MVRFLMMHVTKSFVANAVSKHAWLVACLCAFLQSRILLAQGTLVTVAARDQHAPGLATTVRFDSIGAQGLSSTGDVLIDTFVSDGRRGWWLGPPGGLTIIGLAGTSAPGGSGLFLQHGIGRPAVNDSGEVAFGAATTTDSGIWMGLPGSLSRVLIGGDPAPGTTDATFAPFDINSDVHLTDTGQLGFRSTLVGSHVNSSNNWGIWFGPPAGLKLIWREGDPAPQTPDGTSFLGAPQPFFTNNSQVAFGATLTGPGITAANRTSIWIASDTGPNLVARGGAPAPGLPAGTTFSSVSLTDFSAAGHVALLTVLTGPSINQSNDTAIWVGQPGSLTLVAREGEQAPGLPNGVTIASIETRGVAVNSSGQIAFVAALTGAGVTELNDASLWAGSPGSLALAARQGDQAAGAPAGVTYGEFPPIFNRLQLTSTGEIAFAMELMGPGVTDTNRYGIWLDDQLNYRGSINTLYGPFANDVGQVAFTEIGSSRVLLFTPVPEPQSCVFAAVGLAAVVCQCRRRWRTRIGTSLDPLMQHIPHVRSGIMRSWIHSLTPKHSSRRWRRSPAKHALRRRWATFERLEDRRVMTVDFASAFSIGAALHESVWDLTLDGDGNRCVVGRFTGTVDFDPGPGTYELTSTPAGTGNSFAAKYDPNGNILWAQQFGGNLNNWGPEIAGGSDGSVYVAGSFTGSAQFGATTLTSLGDNDAYAIKFDASGNIVWAHRFGGASSDYGNSVAVDAAGNAYVLAETRTTPSGSNFAPDAFFAKIDPEGNIVWTRAVGASSSTVTKGNNTSVSGWLRGFKLALDGAGDVYATGRIGGTVDFDPGPGTTMLSGTGFVIKLTSSGSLGWARTFVGGYVDAHDIAVDANGNVYSTGMYWGMVDFDPSKAKFNLSSGLDENRSVISATYVSALNSSGNFMWAKSTQSVGGTGYSAVANALALDDTGGIYLTGEFSGTADFDPGAGSFTLTSAGDVDAFVWKLDTSGNFIWAGQMGGTSPDRARGIGVDASGNIYVAGAFFGTADFDPGPSTYNLTSAGGSDFFVTKLTQTNLLPTETSADSVSASSLATTTDGNTTLPIDNDSRLNERKPFRALRRTVAFDKAFADSDFLTWPKTAAAIERLFC